MTEARDCTILGMPLDVNEDDAIATCQPVSGFVVVKALGGDGEIRYLTAATDGLKSVECLGMAEYAALKLRHGLARDMDGEDDD
jgi:hypothetical protein